MKNKREFCVVFPEELDDYLLPLKLKCDQLGITKGKEDNRPVFYFSNSQIKKGFSITEKELKTWINQQGTSTFLEESSKEYQNWERLLFSGKSLNIILSITIVDKDYRPVPKLFSLWLILALFHKDKSVTSAARKMILPYVEQKELPDVVINKLLFTQDYFVNYKNGLHQYYDLNYLHFWAIKLIEHYPYAERTLRFSSKNFYKISNLDEASPLFRSVFKLEIKIESGDSLDFLKTLIDRCPKVNEVAVYSDKVYPIKTKELVLLNKRYLSITNCTFPSYQTNAPALDKVKSLFIQGGNEINFSDWLLPNLTRLKLEGTKIKQLDVTKNLLRLTSFTLCLTKQRSLPNQVYEMVNLKFLKINYSNLVRISSRIKQLKNLKIIHLSGTKFHDFPVEIMLAPNLQDIIDLRFPQNNHLPLNLNKYPNSLAVSSIVFAKLKNIKYFPYELHLIEKLTSINLQFQSIFKIDSRIANFKTLEELIFKQNNFHYLPDVLRQLPNLKMLDLSINKIKKLSFEWIKHVYTKAINLDLQNNPITLLPAIPHDFQIDNTLTSQGTIILTKENLEKTHLKNYQRLFGQNFLTLV